MEGLKRIVLAMFVSACLTVSSDLRFDRPATHTDFISTYGFLTLTVRLNAGLLPLNLAKSFFFLRIWQSTYFSPECERVFFIFLINHTDFPPKIMILLVIYTDFVLDQSGRSGLSVENSGAGRSSYVVNNFLIKPKSLKCYSTITVTIRSHAKIGGGGGGGEAWH